MRPQSALTLPGHQLHIFSSDAEGQTIGPEVNSHCAAVVNFVAKASCTTTTLAPGGARKIAYEALTVARILVSVSFASPKTSMVLGL